MGPVGSGRSPAGAWPEAARPGRVQPAAHGIPMINNFPEIKDYQCCKKQRKSSISDRESAILIIFNFGKLLLIGGWLGAAGSGRGLAKLRSGTPARSAEPSRVQPAAARPSQDPTSPKQPRLGILETTLVCITAPRWNMKHVYMHSPMIFIILDSSGSLQSGLPPLSVVIPQQRLYAISFLICAITSLNSAQPIQYIIH